MSNRYLHLLDTRPKRLYNPDTEEVYNLPQGGTLKQWDGQICSECNFELSLFLIGERAYPLCPHCINHHLEKWGEQVSNYIFSRLISQFQQRIL